MQELEREVEAERAHRGPSGTPSSMSTVPASEEDLRMAGLSSSSPSTSSDKTSTTARMIKMETVLQSLPHFLYSLCVHIAQEDMSALKHASKETPKKALTDAYQICISDEEMDDTDNASIAYSPDATFAAFEGTHARNHVGSSLLSACKCYKALQNYFESMQSKANSTPKKVRSPSQAKTPVSKLRASSSPPLHRMSAKTASQLVALRDHGNC